MMNTVENLLDGIRDTLELKPGEPIHIEISPNRARQLVEDFDQAEAQAFEALKFDIAKTDQHLKKLQKKYHALVGQDMWVF